MAVRLERCLRAAFLFAFYSSSACDCGAGMFCANINVCSFGVADWRSRFYSCWV